MASVEYYNDLGKRLNEQLILRYSPIALKLIYDESEIPEGSIRPVRDLGGHLSMCQAYGMVRRQRQAVTMLKEDNWCVWPLVSYKLVELSNEDIEYMGSKFFFQTPEEGIEHLRSDYPYLERERSVIGFTLAPLETANFEPDIVTIYCRPAQLRSIMMAVQNVTGKKLALNLDSVDSCVHSSIPVLNGKDFNITIPDPGEYERALCDEDEMMFTARAEKLESVIKVMEMLSSAGFGYKQLALGLELDTPRPEFYIDMFKKWGMEPGVEWSKGKSYEGK